MCYLTKLLIAKIIYRWWCMNKWECIISGMIVTEENGNTGTETSPSATLSTISLTYSGLAVNPRLRGDRPTTNRLSHSTTHTYSIIFSRSAFFHHYFPLLHTSKFLVNILLTNTCKWCLEGDGRVKTGENFSPWQTWESWIHCLKISKL